MLGIYIAYSIATKVGGTLGFWGALPLAPLLVAAIGALIEIALLRRIYQAPELFQLLATFAVLLVINDATLWIWGNEDLFGPRAPGLRGSVEILNRRFPSYDLFLIAAGPLVLLGLHFLLAKSRFGRLIRAATQDREMVGALGVNQALLFTAVFACGSALAGLGGALQLAREPANLAMDLVVLGDAFVVVVVGGMEGPAVAPLRTIRPSTMSSASGDCCSNSAATSIALPRSSRAARRAASPVITVTRDAKAPWPNAMRSVRPWTTRTRR